VKPMVFLRRAEEAVRHATACSKSITSRQYTRSPSIFGFLASA
jgi:hypothetical protein